MKLTPYNWPAFSRDVAYPSSPEEYCEASVERLMKYLSPHVVSVKGVREQFKATNKIKLIDFDSPEAQIRYDKAYLAYLEAIGKLKHTSSFAKLVEDLKFNQQAELERADWFARNAKAGISEDYQVAIACKFKGTLAKTAMLLVNKYGIPRNKISMIWGGDTVYAGKVKFYTADEITACLLKTMSGEKVDTKLLREIKKQLLTTQAGLGDLPEELELGPQSADERQREIVKFQSGVSDVCLYSFKSGGVGLSLHHCDEWTKEKVRRKPESNYAVEEDIPNIPTRPRLVFIAPTYSAIEMVQALGRCPRITSLSDTLQTLVFYRNTIEECVAVNVSQKLRCLKQVVRKKESWQDMILQGYHPRERPIVNVDNTTYEHDNEVNSVDEDEDEEE